LNYRFPVEKALKDIDLFFSSSSSKGGIFFIFLLEEYVVDHPV